MSSEETIAELNRQIWALDATVHNLQLQLEAVGAGGVQEKAGWVLVPVETTKEMRMAAGSAYLDTHGYADSWIKAVYKAMLAVAPKAPQQEVQEPDEWVLRATPAELNLRNWEAVYEGLLRAQETLNSSGVHHSWIAAYVGIARQESQRRLPTAPQQEVQVEELNHRIKLLADVLGRCIVASGIVRKDISGLSGPELLQFGEDLCDMLSEKPQQEVQEPVGVVRYAARCAVVDWYGLTPPNGTSLYTTPQPTPSIGTEGADVGKITRIIASLDAIYAAYEPSMGKVKPDDEMLQIVEATKRRLFAWWGEHRETIRAALAAQKGGAA